MLNVGTYLWAGQRSQYNDWLRTGRSGDRIPVGGRDFPHMSRPALGPNQLPVQRVPGLFRGKERPGRDADHSPPSSAVVMKGQSYTSTPLRAVRPVQGVHFTFGTYLLYQGTVLLKVTVTRPPYLIMQRCLGQCYHETLITIFFMRNSQVADFPLSDLLYKLQLESKATPIIPQYNTKIT